MTTDVPVDAQPMSVSGYLREVLREYLRKSVEDRATDTWRTSNQCPTCGQVVPAERSH